MSFSTILAAAAGPLLGEGVEYLAQKGVDYFGADSGIGGYLSKGFLSSGNQDTTLAGQIGSAVAGALAPSKGISMSDLPSVEIAGSSSMAAARMQAAGQAAQIPLGSRNTVPNYLQRNGVRNNLSRVQTIPMPRATAAAAKPNIPLGSAVVKPRTRTRTK